MRGPHLEPVDGAAVDERREHAKTVPEGVTNRAHREHDVKIAAYSFDEEVVHRQRIELNLLALQQSQHQIVL